MNELLTHVPSAIQAFVFTSFLIELTPGPNMGYLAVVAIAHGKKAGFAVVAGVMVGLLAIGLAAALGLTAILQSNAYIYEALRYAGVAFLLYLAWQGWRGGETESDKDSRLKSQFVRGLVNNLLNPKSALFYVAVLPGFVDLGGPILTQTIILTVTYVAIATLIHLLVVLLASTFRLFMSNPDRERFVRRSLSLALAMFALWFAWSTAK
jgi:threonine/homoserine/homoserine lactone efflux protein